MTAIRLSAQARTAPFLRQVMVSVTATIVATTLLTGLQREFGGSKPNSDMTTGGKFAARIEGAATPSAPISLPAAHAPVLLAEVDRQPPTLFEPVATAPATMPVLDAPRTTRKLVKAEPRRHVVVEAAARDIVPPRRADFIAEAAAAHDEEPDTGLLSTAKSIVRQAAWLGGTVWDRITPAGLIP